MQNKNMMFIFKIKQLFFSPYIFFFFYMGKKKKLFYFKNEYHSCLPCIICVLNNFLFYICGLSLVYKLEHTIFLIYMSKSKNIKKYIQKIQPNMQKTTIIFFFKIKQLFFFPYKIFF